MAIQQMKVLLGIPASDSTLDSQLLLIDQITEKRLAALLGASSVPESLQHIVTEVAVVRFNRIGSEGMSAHTVEGEQITYSESDFAPYMDEIDMWKAENDKHRGKWRCRFL